jgi:serine/threonine protein kinase
MLEQVGPYTIDHLIASGGMADVFLASKHGPLGFRKRVVLKRIAKAILSDADAQRMFIDEAQIHSRLSHPHIVQLFDLGQDDDSFYMVLEWVEGINLREKIGRMSTLPEITRLAQALQITIDLLGALDYAHNVKDEREDPVYLVHRDISPSNILIAHSGPAKLCDFGLAKSSLQQIVTRAGITKGKLRYMSPEQLEGRLLDQRSDLFSLGACLFEMLTLEPLYGGDSDDAIIRSTRSGAYMSRLNLLGDYPKDVRDLLHHALQPSPGSRFASAHEFRHAARQILAPIELEEFQSHPIGDLERFHEGQAGKPKVWSRMLSACLLAPLALVLAPLGPLGRVLSRRSQGQRSLKIQL